MRSKFSKYKFDYSPSDYKYNLRYKWMSRHKRIQSEESSSSYENLYFIEMLNNPDQTYLHGETFTPQVQQLSPEMCVKIDQAWLSGQSRVFVLATEIHGHYINLDNMTLVNTSNMSKRRIYTSKTLPEGAIIYHTFTQTAMRLTDSPSAMRQKLNIPHDRILNVKNLSPPYDMNSQSLLMGSELQQARKLEIQVAQHHQDFHWMESIHGHNLKYKPLKRSLSDAIEKYYSLYCRQISNGVTEIYWQNKRYIIDLKQNTLQNSQTLQMSRISRINLKEVNNIKKFMQQSTYSEPEAISSSKQKNDYEWQFEIFKFLDRGIQWESYDLNTQKKLEKKYQEWIKLGDKNKRTNFEVERGSQAFYIDFKLMIEHNTIYRTTREIRRIDPNESII